MGAASLQAKLNVRRNSTTDGTFQPKVVRRPWIDHSSSEEHMDYYWRSRCNIEELLPTNNKDSIIFESLS